MVRTARDPASIDLAARFVDMHKRLRDGGDTSATMQLIVDLAVAAVPGCDWATIMVRPQAKRPRNAAASTSDALAVDELQIAVLAGPGVSAASESQEVRSNDLSREDRWPAFTARALTTTSVRSALCLPIGDAVMRSALNLYGSRPTPLDDAAFPIAGLFANHVRGVLFHARSSGKATNLEVALGNSRQIGMAVGILMQKDKLTPEQAFSSLQASSDNLRRKVNDVAAEVTETGSLP